MSRIGQKPILIIPGVEVKETDGKVEVKGPKGQLSLEVPSEIKVEIKDNQIHFSPVKSDKKTKALWGLMRTLVFNMIEGVTKGFDKKLEINGVGFRARVEGKDLFLDVGFSHPVKIGAKEGISFSVEKNVIIVSGIEKELVGQVAAEIRRVKPPEPYKGKGIKYVDEVIRRKLGKKAAGG
ncbi:MAG: 50S ribosomal protein L6 [Candidatus Paceibacterota bacterium]|jgi:large subunit ribosomal protein L6|nr:50S ribosomal protein L6 [Candidatus Paceibacterota bacterium]MDD5555279.1 50S ribosomal protein L6 [Candidatus Paceibacterota bacterium]